MPKIKKPAKKQSKKSIVKKLQKQCEQLWKNLAIEKVGRECQVKRYYPQVSVDHSEII